MSRIYFRLADLAAFHANVSAEYKLTDHNTWICFGGSYPGSLSAWFRLKVKVIPFYHLGSAHWNLYSISISILKYFLLI